jgi:hypothetical protein
MKRLPTGRYGKLYGFVQMDFQDVVGPRDDIGLW